MGFYVNVSGMRKEDWLVRYGRQVPLAEATVTDNELPVILVDNGSFSAAGIAYCEQELEIFLREDGRAKKAFMCKREDLKPFLPKGFGGEK